MANLDTTTIIIEGRGPFTLEELKTVKEGNGLYLLTGRLTDSRARNNGLLYCGITEKVFCKRINNKHDAVKKIKPNSLSIWVGCLVYPTEHVRKYLEEAEGAYVSCWDIKLNDRKKNYYPSYSICIVSRYRKTDGLPYKRWPSELAFVKNIKRCTMVGYRRLASW